MGVFQIGNPTKCAICHRFNQWVQDCPNRDNGNTNFENNTISIFNENIPLITINSGHYAIHNTKAKQIINNIDRETSTQILLLVVENQDN